jgi:hypothetical protein
MFTTKFIILNLLILSSVVCTDILTPKNTDDDILFLSQFRQLQETQRASSCTKDGDCINGTCHDNVCVCTYGYSTYPPDSYPACNYQLKHHKTAFFYELFLSFGAGHFYSERNLMGAFKLICFVLGILIICLIPITTKYLSERLNSDVLVITVSCAYYLYALGLAFWFIYDLVMFGLNKYKDGNGQDLVPWE